MAITAGAAALSTVWQMVRARLPCSHFFFQPQKKLFNKATSKNRTYWTILLCSTTDDSEDSKAQLHILQVEKKAI